MGDKGRKFVDFNILSSQTGFAIAYLIFIGQQMDQVICFETLYEECNLKFLYIIIAGIILTPICWLRSFKYLAYVSMASNIFLIFSLFIIIGYCFQHHSEHPEFSENLNMMSFSAIPLFFGIAVFDFEGNGVVINLHASMKEPEKFEKVLNICLSIYVASLCIFSTIAYWVSSSFLAGYSCFARVLTFFPHATVIWIGSEGHGDFEPAARQLNVDDPSVLLLRAPRQLPNADDACLRDHRVLQLL